MCRTMRGQVSFSTRVSGTSLQGTRVACTPRNCSAELVLYDVPGDDNCLFYAIMLGMHRCLGSEQSVQLDNLALRKGLRAFLIELSNAGRRRSRFSREWLSSALLEVDPSNLAFAAGRAELESGRLKKRGPKKTDILKHMIKQRKEFVIT